jgi:gentisate 1,2-dioxygenase
MEEGDSLSYRFGSGILTRIFADDEAILFSINDRPVMEALQLYREEVEN